MCHAFRKASDVLTEVSCLASCHRVMISLWGAVCAKIVNSVKCTL